MVSAIHSLRFPFLVADLTARKSRSASARLLARERAWNRSRDLAGRATSDTNFFEKSTNFDSPGQQILSGEKFWKKLVNAESYAKFVLLKNLAKLARLPSFLSLPSSCKK